MCLCLWRVGPNGMLTTVSGSRNKQELLPSVDYFVSMDGVDTILSISFSSIRSPEDGVCGRERRIIHVSNTFSELAVIMTICDGFCSS